MCLTDNHLLKFVNYNNQEYLYAGNYNTLFKYSELLNDILNLLPSFSYEYIVSELKEKYSEEYVKKQVSILKDWICKVDNHNKDKRYELDNITEANWLDGKVLTSLWLNISHDCNLRCIYCYGNGGNYGKNRKLMTVEVAKKIIDHWFKYLKKDSKDIMIVFFGGEPLMNKKVLLFAVNYINKLLKDYSSANYILTTNGTIMDDELLELFIKNNFSITLSIDGGQDIQDRNRPFISGNGSFNKVKDTISLLREKKYNTLNARLTLLHDNVRELKASVEQLWEIGITNVDFEMVASTDEKLKLTIDDIKILKPQIREMAKITLNNINSDKKNYVSTLLKYGKVVHNHLHNSCIFYSKNSLLVEPDGDIFKCHRLVSNDEFTVGNILTQFNWEKYNQPPIINSKCVGCWASNICIPCPQINYLYNNSTSEPYELHCEFTRFIIEENLKIYSSLAENNQNILEAIYR